MDSNTDLIRKAIYNMGGTSMASRNLRVAPSTICKWIKNGVIPNLDQARKVAAASGYKVETLRPFYEQKYEETNTVTKTISGETK